MRKIIYLFLFIILLSNSSLAGLKAYDFKLKTLEGKEVKLSDYRGKVVILIFWSTTCPVCEREMPVLSKWYHEKYKDKGVEVLSIVINTKDKKKIKKTIEKWGFNFVVLLPDKDVLRKYFVPGTPTFYIIRKDGTVGKMLFGKQKIKTFEKYIEKFLED